MKFYSKSLNQTQTSTKSKEETPKIPHIVDFLINKAHIEGIPNRSIGVLLTDASDLLGAYVTKGIFKTPVIVYRKENMYYLYNNQLILSGAIEIKSKDDDTVEVYAYGKEMNEPKSGWNSSKFFNSLAINISLLGDAISKKFEGFDIFTKAV